MDSDAGIFTAIIVIFSIVATVVPLVFVARFMSKLFKGNAMKQQLLQTGIPAQATITAMQDTGTRINDNPMIALTLNVEVPGRPVYQVVVQEIVPLVGLGMIQPGRAFAARVDPSNPNNVAIDWSGQASPKVEHGGVARLIATGIAGNAQLQSFEPMPMPPVEGDAIVKFSVLVSVPDGRPNFTATFAQRVPPAVMGRFAPGMVIPCKVDPRDPSSLVIDFWAWAGIAPPQAAPALNAPMAPTPFNAAPGAAMVPSAPAAGPYGAPGSGYSGGGGGGGWPQQ